MAGLFSKPSVPVTPEPTVMPLPDDAAAQKKKKAAIAKQQQTGGRISTILSADDKLGS